MLLFSVYHIQSIIPFVLHLNPDKLFIQYFIFSNSIEPFFLLQASTFMFFIFSTLLLQTSSFMDLQSYYAQLS
jgi:hypothetical protein